MPSEIERERSSPGPWRSEHHIDASYRILADSEGGTFIGIIGPDVGPMADDRPANVQFAVAKANADLIVEMRAALVEWGRARKALAMPHTCAPEGCACDEEERAADAVVSIADRLAATRPL